MLNEQEWEKLKALSGDDGREARAKLRKLKRHSNRIRTLERVLDPSDEDAIGDMSHRETYEAELERRRGDRDAVEKELRKLSKKGGK